MADRIDNLVDEKTALIQRLADILEELEAEKVDMLCDAELRPAIKNHAALQMKPRYFATEDGVGFTYYTEE